MSSQREHETNTVCDSDTPHLWPCHWGCKWERKTPPPVTSGQRGNIARMPHLAPPPTRGALCLLLPPQALSAPSATRTQGLKLISAEGLLIGRSTSEGLKTCILYRRTTFLYRGVLAPGEEGVEGIWVYASAFIESGITQYAAGTCLSSSQAVWGMRLYKLPTLIPVCSK